MGFLGDDSVHCLRHTLCHIAGGIDKSSIFGINIVDNIYFEFGMIGLAFIIGVIALRKGKRHHQSNLPLYLFFSGMFFLLAKEIFHEFHLLLLIPAVVFILSAHFYNYRLCAKTEFHGSNKKAVE